MTNKRYFVDSFSNTLDGSISDSDTSFDLVDASGLGSIPAGGYIPLTIDDRAGGYEIIHVTAVATNTITADRGMEGTTAASWTVGDTVDCRLTAGALNDLSPVSSIYATSPGAYDVFTGTARWYPSKNVVLTSVSLTLGGVGTVDAIFNVAKNGVALFSGSKPTVTLGNHTGTPVTLDELITPSDYLTINCEQKAGTDAVLRLDYIQEEL